MNIGKYRTSIEDFEGVFWFPDDEKFTLVGKVKNGDLLLEISNENVYKYYNSIINDDNIIFHCKTNSNEDVTIITNYLNNYRSDGCKIKLNFDIKFILYDELYSSLEEIKFDSIVIHYRNINKWINPHTITHSETGEKGSSIKIDINEEYMLYFLKRIPIKPRDYHAHLIGFNVYVKIISKRGVKTLFEWLDTEQIIKDFF